MNIISHWWHELIVSVGLQCFRIQCRECWLVDDDRIKLKWFSGGNLGLHIGFCFVDVLYLPYAILYYINRSYFQCIIKASQQATSEEVRIASIRESESVFELIETDCLMTGRVRYVHQSAIESLHDGRNLDHSSGHGIQFRLLFLLAGHHWCETIRRPGRRRIPFLEGKMTVQMTIQMTIECMVQNDDDCMTFQYLGVGQATVDEEAHVEVLPSAGDSDVQAEALRVKHLLQNPPATNRPVVLISVNSFIQINSCLE